jgi:hypothetical protein
MVKMGRPRDTLASYREFVDLKALLERAIDCEQQGRLDEAISAYVALVRDGWGYAAQLDPFERLLQIHLHRREIDAAWCAASILEGFGRLEGTERELYEDYVPRRLPARRGRLDTAAWELLRDRDEDMGLSAMLGAIAEKLAPPMDSRVDSAVLAWAADALGVRDGAVALVDPALEAHADLDEVRAGYLLRERLFFAGREATALVAPYYALARCDLRTIKAALGDSAVGDIEEWHRSIRRTRLRAGLLVCGEPWVVRTVLRGEGTTDEDLAELAAFSVSPEHHRLRALIGVAIGMGADALADPTPTRTPVPAAEPAFSDTFERTCASCEKAAKYPTRELFGHTPQVNEEASGLDGRPSYSDGLASSAAILDRELSLLECPDCGHIAQAIEVAFPRLDSARGARASLLALEAHDPRARRYLYIAQLYGDADLREQGLWVLRAAWANEAVGRFEVARVLRRRAGMLLDDSVREGYALVPVRGGTSLMLAEIFRVGGDFERAMEHCRRGGELPMSDAKRSLIVVAMHVIERRSEPLTRARAREEFATFSKEQLTALSAKAKAACPTIPPLRIRPSRRFFSTKLSMPQLSRDAEAITFAEDFLDADLLPELLRVGRPGMWAGVLAHPELFPVLLRATNHADTDVRSSALDALYNKTFYWAVRDGSGFESDALKGHEDAIDAVVARLSDDDDARVRKASAVLRQLICLDAACAPRIAAGARRALPKWTKHLSTTGDLERLIALAPPPGLIEIGSEERRARSEAEMRFAASIRPCAKCGAPPGKLDLSGANEQWSLVGTCAYCGEPRTLRFWTSRDPTRAKHPPRELGGAGPSQILDRSELGAELERVKALICAEPSRLAPPGRAAHDEALGRAITCVLELLKLAPDVTLAAERDRLVALEQGVHVRPLSVVRLDPPKKMGCGDYDLDAFIVELDGKTLDFRFELGRGVGIFSAVPAATGDRLRLFHVDGAAYTVDEPELYEDPFVFDLPLTAWHGELGVLGDRSVVIAVTIEVSANPPRYRCEVTRRTVGGETQTQTCAWAHEPALTERGRTVALIPVARIGGHGKWICRVAFSPDGERFVTGDDSGRLAVYTRTGDVVAEIAFARQAVPPNVFDVAWSPDDVHVAALELNGLRLLSNDTLAIVATNPTCGFRVAFCDGGRTLVVAGFDRRLHVFDVPSLTERGSIALDTGIYQTFDVQTLAADPDGAFVAVGDNGGWDEDETGKTIAHGMNQVTLANATTIKSVGDIERSRLVHELHFDRWRKRLFVVASDGIGVWDPTGSQIKLWKPYADRVKVSSEVDAGSIAISERWIATTTKDGWGVPVKPRTIDLCDPSTYERIATVCTLSQEVRWIAMSPDGALLLAPEIVDGAHYVKLWRIDDT